MAIRLIKSALWLAGLTTLGYGLFMTLTPSEENITKNLPGLEKSPNEILKKKQQFVDVLQSAADANKPLYRLNKEGIDKELKKQ
jgi:hypothetical protein